MYENGKEVKIGKKTYKAVFNVIALEEIAQRYGGVQELSKALEADYSKAINEYAWILALLVRQGTALSNFEEGTNEKAPTIDEIKLLMKPKEFMNKDLIMGVIQEGLSFNTQSEDDEEVDEVLQEVLASKNAEGAGEN